MLLVRLGKIQTLARQGDKSVRRALGELSLTGAGQDCTDLKWRRTTGKALFR